MKNLAFIILLSVIVMPQIGHAQDKTFPTDSEIDLLITQTDRAVQQYKPLIDTEEKELGEAGKDTIIKDRQVVQALELAVKKSEPNLKALTVP